ncbi:MAG: NAD(P)-dependent oxidoreductase [Polyangiaceae bacterium]|nr:NAD(P)-dependent oxidoreductase [Polyangiaceae bacterium]NUQ71970.1 NAD(P)-dependent oxidoreductase [Polyangiaceae bacterium]
MERSLFGKACLVTGGAGFGGSHLTEQLLARGAKVVVLDRWLPKNSYMVLAGLLSKVDFLQGDVRDFDFVRQALERFEIDTVFHLAAQPLVPVSNALPLETLSVNAMGTFTVLEAIRCSTQTKRLVFASSGAYYGTTSGAAPIQEDDAPLVATNMYAPSKAAADLAVRCYTKIYGLKAAACRFMNTYGPGDTNFSRLVPRAAKNLIEGGDFDFGDRDDGTTVLTYMHVRDMASAYIRTAERLEGVTGEALNFGGDLAISTREMASLCARAFGNEARSPAFRGPPREVSLRKVLDTRKAKELLGWKPETPLEEGLRETFAWYREFWDRL